MSLHLDVVVGVVASTGITPILGRFVGTFYSTTEDVEGCQDKKWVGYHGIPKHPHAS